MKYTFSILVILSIFTISSCSEYQEVLKGNDLGKKYEMAKSYYNKKQYYKALPLLEELVPVYKGSKEGEEMYYYLPFCYYGTGEYIVAAYHFKNFFATYPTNVHAEECLFMNAKCYMKMSPKYELSQDFTEKSINEFQLFTNSFPTSALVSQANDDIDQMRAKLQVKAFAGAKLYYQMTNYKASAVALSNLIRNYPDLPNIAEACFLIVKSDYLYALNSIVEKQKDRFEKTVSVYNQYKDKFAGTRYEKEAKTILDNSTSILNKLNIHE